MVAHIVFGTCEKIDVEKRSLITLSKLFNQNSFSFQSRRWIFAETSIPKGRIQDPTRLGPGCGVYVCLEAPTFYSISNQTLIFLEPPQKTRLFAALLKNTSIFTITEVSFQPSSVRFGFTQGWTRNHFKYFANAKNELVAGSRSHQQSKSLFFCIFQPNCDLKGCFRPTEQCLSTSVKKICCGCRL